MRNTKILAYNCRKILFECKKGWIETSSDKVYKWQSETILDYNHRKILFKCKKGWIETSSDKVYKWQSEQY